MFKALVVHLDNGRLRPVVQDVAEDRLPDGDVTVAVEFTTLNHQDGMLIGGVGRRAPAYPHIPGCDFAGTVEDSRHPGFKPGDRVVLTGWHVGLDQWGGFAQKARVRGDWLLPLPHGLTTRQAMAIGTPGLTAMLAVIALEQHDVLPDRGDVLITGTPGGVGSTATAILAKRGYRVVASIGQPTSGDYVRELGAADTIDRLTLTRPPEDALAPERWAACVDSVGGPTLAHVLAETAFGGTCVTVGLMGNKTLTTSTLPFIMRAVNLLGIHSDNCSMVRRRVAWQRLVADLPPGKLDVMTSEATLDELPLLAGVILEGRVSGRIVVDVNA